MDKAKTLKIGINNASDEWFKAKIDRKILKELSKRSDMQGWSHIIIYFFCYISRWRYRS